MQQPTTLDLKLLICQQENTLLTFSESYRISQIIKKQQLERAITICNLKGYVIHPPTPTVIILCTIIFHCRVSGHSPTSSSHLVFLLWFLQKVGYYRMKLPASCTTCFEFRVVLSLDWFPAKSAVLFCTTHGIRDGCIHF